ncbi:MAG: hypothetical protein R2909_14810 [Gemmatimonadales bacterium]
MHHKMVDDQVETYTAALLRELKANHEGWVSEQLEDEPSPAPIRVTRIKGNEPPYLLRLRSGTDVASIVEGARAHSFSNDELTSQAEVDLVARFADQVEFFGDFSAEMDAGQRVHLLHDLTTLVGELDEHGFWVFGAREVQRIEGGFGPPSPWIVVTLRVLRSTNPAIVQLRLDGTGGSSDQSAPAV